MSDIYKISIKGYRTKAKTRLRVNLRCYDSLVYKDSEYARSIKALGDLHRKVLDIYDDAPDEL